MNSITIVSTATKSIPKPEPLPEIVETPRQAFLAGWWGGICCGIVLGTGATVFFLQAIGRLQ